MQAPELGASVAEGAGASISLGLALAFLVFGLLLGFVIGIRARQILAGIKTLATAAVSIRELLKSHSSQDEEGDTEQVEDEAEAEEQPEDIMNSFMSCEVDSGLDDHPDVAQNPIMMYHIKVAKEEARREKRKQQMIAEGMDEEDAERILINEAAGGGQLSAGDGRLNALAVLIAVGARVTSTDQSESAESVLAEERKRNARTIDTYLQKHLGIDTAKVQRPKSSTHKSAANALEVALRTSKEPFGGTRATLVSETAEYAMRGRNALREIDLRRRNAGIITPGRAAKATSEEERGDGGEGDEEFEECMSYDDEIVSA